MAKKWALTLCAVVILVVAGFTVRIWVPWVLSFATTNNDQIKSVKDLVELVSKIVSWLAAAFLAIWRWKSLQPEIEITRERGGELSKLNVNLNDLLVAPYGIAHLLSEYESEPTAKKWRVIKKRAEKNHDKLENLYQALGKLSDKGFFGQYPNLPNDMQRVIDAKMHVFYLKIDGFPWKPHLTNAANIAMLRKSAHELEGYNDQVRKAQATLSHYIKENSERLLKLLKIEEMGKDKKKAA